MTGCILEAINSSTQAYISALTGRLRPSISHDQVSAASAVLCREQYAKFCSFHGMTTVPVRPSFFGHAAFFRVQTVSFASNFWGNERLL
jgi:hypothetical protein